MGYYSEPTANKGEWSELYVLFKVFDERSIPGAGANLEPLPDLKYKFLKIFRSEEVGREYEYSLEIPGKVRILDAQKRVIKTVSTGGLSAKTHAIFESIKEANTSSFAMPSLGELMEDYNIKKVKASSTQKTDLLAIVSDQIHDTTPKLGFSIKSHIGGAPTLINPSNHTNFVYAVEGFVGNIDEVNTIEGGGKVQRRLSLIRKCGGTIVYRNALSTTFNLNMRLTDTALPSAMASLILGYYSGKGSKWDDLATHISQDKTLNINPEELEYKLKGFLRTAALGMVPATKWSGLISAYGGYIVMLNDGRLVCYHLFNDDEFKQYLYANTRLDTPSTSRWDFGKLYKNDEGNLFINLNLQVRFIK